MNDKLIILQESYTFIQVTNPCIIYSQFAFIISTCWALQYGRTHVTHIRTYRSIWPCPQWVYHRSVVRASKRYSAMLGSTPSLSKYFYLRTLLQYLHFTQVTNPFLSLTLLIIFFLGVDCFCKVTVYGWKPINSPCIRSFLNSGACVD